MINLRKDNENFAQGDYKDKLERDHRRRVSESLNYKSMYDKVQTDMKSKAMND